MRILYLEWKSFGNEDIQEAFKELGHELIMMPYDSNDVYHDEALEKKLMDAAGEGRADVVFSSNYYPPVAIACNEAGIPYVSWIYDNPFVMLYSYTVIFETNHIYVFDKEQYEEFARNNIRTIHYMPLATNPKRLQKLVTDEGKRREFLKQEGSNKTDIAFVGSLYDEEHTFYRRIKDIPEYTRGYLEGIMAAQSKIYGYNFVQSMLTDKIMDDMSKDLPMTPGKDSVAKREYLFAEYAINREITARERYELIAAVGSRFGSHGKPGMDIYTQNPDVKIDGVINHGSADHLNIAPFIFNNARINLNITLRSIHTGIPFRSFEILGAGGFLLSNYQADYADCYTDGEDYVSFSSREDMLDKIEYYLSHEKERAQIAANGLKTTMDNHTYAHRLKIMLEEL